MGRIASEGGDDERGVCAGAGPLLDDVAFVAFEFSSTLEDSGGSVFLKISSSN